MDNEGDSATRTRARPHVVCHMGHGAQQQRRQTLCLRGAAPSDAARAVDRVECDRPREKRRPGSAALCTFFVENLWKTPEAPKEFAG